MQKFLLLLFCFPVCFLLSSEKEPYIILSIDGGGIKGIIPATVLTLLEEELGCGCAEVFDCISGTSTGGILAVGLTRPSNINPSLPEYKAEDLLNIYLSKHDEIFYRPFLYKLTSIWGWIAPKYSNEGLKRLLIEELESGNINNSLCDIVIPSYDLTTHAGFHFEYFKNDNILDKNFNVIDVVLATTAAPTYFPSVPVVDLVNPHLTHNLIDGGIIANNPAEFVLMECLKHISLDDRDIHILSIGTGVQIEESIAYHESKDWGVLEYLNPLIDNLFDASSSLVVGNLRALMNMNLLNFFRVNITVPEEASVLDNVEDENIELLHQLGKQCYIENFVQTEQGQSFLKLLKNRVSK
jgi:uncharacterized protein